jgi:hypothetical protein
MLLKDWLMNLESGGARDMKTRLTPSLLSEQQQTSRITYGFSLTRSPPLPTGLTLHFTCIRMGQLRRDHPDVFPSRSLLKDTDTYIEIGGDAPSSSLGWSVTS